MPTTRKPVPVGKSIEKNSAPEEVAALARGLTVLRRVATADAPIGRRTSRPGRRATCATHRL